MKIKATAFERCFRDNAVECARGGRGARLAPTFLLYHEMGVSAGLDEKVAPEQPAKIIFELPGGKPGNAQLLWFVDYADEPDIKPTVMLVNGRRLEHRFEKKRLLTGGWDRHTIPAGWLKPGHNEIIFTACDRLRIDPGAGQSSFKSFDGGKTWHANALGPRNNLAGEYMVRLRVQGHPAQGLITSPVIDLADPKDEGRIAPRLAIARVRLTARMQQPRGTGIRFEMRSGDSPWFEAACWTPWRITSTLAAPGRFVQWRATLSTRRMEATPVLSAVTLDADVRADERGLADYRVVSWERPELKRSSYEFTWLAPHPRARRLVQQWRLDEVVASGRDDLERCMLLRNWCHKQWIGWWKDRYPFCPTWDPLDILDAVKNNWGYGMCTHWAALFVGAASALGYVARVSVIDHHCLPEVWSDDLARWIIMDPANEDGNSVLELDGKLINNLEVRRAVEQGRGKDIMRRVWRPWWSQVAPGIAVQDMPFNDREHRVPFAPRSWPVWNRCGIALRNNHLVQASPAEDQHGDRQYHWNGYLWWTENSDPKYPEYALQTTREADLYWTVGKVRATAQMTKTPGVLEVRFEHTMPNFERYEVQLDGGPWAPAESRMDWTLLRSENRLAVRAVSAFNRAGAGTQVVIRRI